MVRVKICGVTRGADLAAAVDAGADAVGLISDVPVDTPREIDAGTAAELSASVPPLATSVLVTMPDDVADAVDLARTVEPDAVQLHGEFDAEQLGYLRAETGCKVLPVVDHADHDRARELDEAADAVVVDSMTDEGAGGTGRTHDWAATGELVEALASPVVLAGGLTPENVAEAVRTAVPFAVDVAGGVERAGGEKDHNAVARFVRNAGRGIDLEEPPEADP